MIPCESCLGIDAVFKHDSQTENNMPAYQMEDSAIIELLDSITPERAKELSDRIVPLVRQDGKLYEIEIPDLFNQAFTWDPELEELVDTNLLTLVGAIRTFHRCSYHMFFKPWIAEVLAQIPEEYLNEVQAFEVLTDDPIITIHTRGKFYGHSTTTLLYKYQD